MDSCVAAARDTVNFLSRAMQYQPGDRFDSGTGSQNLISACATTMLCTHIWRCTLFLCFRGFFTEASICVQVSAAIGDAREVNIACGRNLYGFLRMLGEKLAAGVNLEQDEGMMALVSGDVQGSTESSWVWNGSETGQALNSASPRHDHSHNSGNEYPIANGATEISIALSPDETNDWGGWGYIERMLQRLNSEKLAREHSQQQLAPGLWNGVSGRSTPVPTASSSRIAIANII